MSKSSSRQSADAKLRPRAKQLRLLKDEPSAYGRDLLKTRAGRARRRPLSTRETMHMVLRSTQATGAWSFRRPGHDRRIKQIVSKFAKKFGVRVLSMANAGNHLHLQIKLSNRFLYRSFVSAVTGGIALAITGRHRWAIAQAKQIATNEETSSRPQALKFWDRRPFTRVVKSFVGYLKLKDYVRINQLEGHGYKRAQARMMIEAEKVLWDSSQVGDARKTDHRTAWERSHSD